MMPDALQLLWCIVIFLVVAVPVLIHDFDTSFYVAMYRRVAGSPPPMFFPIFWLTMYALIVTAEIFHILTAPAPPLPVPVMFFVIVLLWTLNIAINHFWSTVFFDRHQFWFGFVCTLLIWATAVVVEIFYGITGAWVSFWIYLAYPIAMLFPIYLNLRRPRSSSPRPFKQNARPVEFDF